MVQKVYICIRKMFDTNLNKTCIHKILKVNLSFYIYTKFLTLNLFRFNKFVRK